MARNASDRDESVASVDAIPPALRMPGTVLADNGVCERRGGRGAARARDRGAGRDLCRKGAAGAVLKTQPAYP